MVRFGWRVLALLLIAAGAGCTPHPATDGPATDSPASASGSPSRASSIAPGTVADPSPVRTTASPSAARPTVPSSAPSAARQVPPVSATARAAGLIDIRTVVPDAVIDLRYATSDNFVGVRLYPAGARCLVHKSMAAGLKVAADRLRRQGLVVIFWDCYRPHAVQVRMFQIVPDPNWVARPGPLATSHEAGRSVDVTLAYAASERQCANAQQVQGHCLLDMGTGFDDFTARSHAFAMDGVSTRAESNRARLRSAMDTGGITVYPGEWWHFDGPGALAGRPYLTVPLS
jgi:zinc D-Ala-D-Ala dipeptidase